LRAQAVYENLTQTVIPISVTGCSTDVSIAHLYDPENIKDKSGDVRAHTPTNASMAYVGCATADLQTRYITDFIDQRLHSMFSSAPMNENTHALESIAGHRIQMEV
jgi:hypothetical protein